MSNSVKGWGYSRKGLLLALGLLGVSYLVGVRYFGTPSARYPERAGDSKLRPAPGFQLPDGQGKLRSLEDYRGKVVLLHLWASWCPPCLSEMPDLLEFAKSFPNTDLRVIAISLDENWAEARRILPETILPAGFVSLLDLPRAVPDLYGSYQYPETYLLNRDLRIVHKFVGAQAWTGDEMMKLFKKLF